MAGQRSFIGVIFSRVALGTVVAVIMLVATRLMHFPPVFQFMFVMYAVLGTTVFILIDAPNMPSLNGWQSVAALIVFYAVLSGAYIAGANFLPQYDPTIEKGKIDKIVKPKLAATEKGKLDELLKRSDDLSARSQAILKRMEALGGEEAKKIEASVGGSHAGAAPVPAGGNLVALGKEQYDLQECYNCHKIGGKGSVKKRGPILDNIGTLMKPEEMKEKLLNPRAWMADGFEKEYNKKLMPDKYKELMSDAEIDALVAYLSSLKDTSIETPKPIKKT